MQNLINQAPPKKNYDFIDSIRCVAMMAIVAEHSVGSYVFAPGSTKYWCYISFIQLTKFGTIAFFLLAGFLISENFTNYTPTQYLRRRVSTTFGPWVFWSLVYVVAMIINIHIKAGIYHDNEFNLANILNQVKIVYLYTNYWFIINFLVSITILLVFRRYLYSIYFGAILLLFTLFYTINIHYEWIDPSHTTAILGFVFFLWLGAQLRKNWEQVDSIMVKTSWLAIIVLLLLTFGLSVYEINVLNNIKSIDPLNTLRFSSVLFSLVAFALLLKVKTFGFTKYLHPRQTTYGIYLIHYIIISFVLPQVFIHLTINDSAIPVFYLIKVLTIIGVYLLTYFIVIGISRSPFKKLIGV